MAKIVINECKHCGKNFPTIYTSQKYCSKKCRNVARKINNESKGQLCWKCKNATGECSWSKCFTPVKGWDAEPTIIQDSEIGEIPSFKIKHCPQYFYG